MPMHVRVSGTPRLVTGMHVRVGGVIRPVQQAFVRVGGVIRQFYAAAAVSVDFTSRSGSRSGGGPVTSNVVTATGTPTGGTFAWRRTGGDSRITATLSGSASTAFTANIFPAETINATFVCDYTVNGVTVTSPAVGVTLFDSTS